MDQVRFLTDERRLAADRHSAERRRCLEALAGLAGGGLLAAAAPVRAADSFPMPTIEAMQAVVGGRPITRGRVVLELPRLADNGNSVAASIAVDSPMTEADHVRRIWLFSDRNPRPLIGEFGLGPWSGRAAVATRVRLSGTQHVVALAETSDGRLWADVTEVVVTLSACLDEG